MAGKRGGKIPRPIANDEWTPKFGNNAAGKDWSEMASSKLRPGLIKFWEIVTRHPRSGANPGRHHRLKGELATKILSGARLEQWQHEISSGGRIWFLIDDKNKIVWVTKVSPGHPSKTD